VATILIVDDLPANRRVLATQLGGEGYRLLEAADGREGLAVAQAEHPDLVITDVLMPVMDGFEFVRRLRIEPATRTTPVVFCTAHYGEREARELALSSGVAYVLTKPMAAADVLTVVGRALSGDLETQRAPLVPPLTIEFDREHLRLVTDKLSEKGNDLKTANERLRALINIGLELASERDSGQLLRSVCEAARDLFAATYVTLGILDRADGALQDFVTSGFEGGHWMKTGDAVSGVLATVIADRRMLRGENPGGDPCRLHLPALHPDVQAFLVAPIVSPSHVYGWICLVRNDGSTFGEDDEDLVMALAGQLGRVYENGYLYTVAKKRAEEAQRYLDTGEIILLALDLEGRVTLANRYACSVLGWASDELLGRDWIETCLPASSRDAVRTKFHDLLLGDLAIVENPVLTRSGDERLIEWRNTVLRDDAGHVIGTFSSGLDITDRRILEGQYQQAQKMEAVGRLAGGVAHDFNNLLTVILGSCDILLEDLSPDDPHQADIAEIQKAGARAAELTRQLLAFSRKEIIQPRLLDLNLIATEMRVMLGRLIGEDVRIVLTLRPGLAAIKADRSQIEQIVMNLAVNARDAMPKGGTLTIETANVDLDEHYAKAHAGVKPGPYVVLTMTDTGTGMTQQVQARLFEPFFTTKEIGKGTGLGMATVYGIATRAGGTIAVYSEIGRGTSLKVYFPRADAAERVVVAPVPMARPRTGTQTVLVVDDEAELRELARRLLQRQGYTVLVAANAAEALQLFEEHPSIDVLLTDVIMPGASGPELTRELIEQRPALRVIYMSGYTEEGIVDHGVLEPGIAFLHKPFTGGTLGQRVRDVLER
jgi:PAS domain S-box-containing protein